MLTTTKSKAAIESKGGGKIEAIEVDENAANLSSPDTAHDIGYVKESTFSKTVETSNIIDETEEVIKRKKGTTESGFSGVFLQSGKGHYAFFDEVEDKFYRSYKYEGIKGNDHVEIFFAIGEFDSNITVKHSDGTIPFNYVASKVENNVSFPASAFHAFCSATGTNSFYGSLSSSNIVVSAGRTHTIIATNKTTGVASIVA